jgi:hypothetical protein
MDALITLVNKFRAANPSVLPVELRWKAASDREEAYLARIKIVGYYRPCYTGRGPRAVYQAGARVLLAPTLLRAVGARRTSPRARASRSPVPPLGSAGKSYGRFSL